MKVFLLLSFLFALSYAYIPIQVADAFRARGSFSCTSMFDCTTGIVLTDPQNDFLCPGTDPEFTQANWGSSWFDTQGCQGNFLLGAGTAWPVLKWSVKAQNSVNNQAAILNAAVRAEIPVFVSPHHLFSWDHSTDDAILSGMDYTNLPAGAPPTLGLFDPTFAAGGKAQFGGGIEQVMSHLNMYGLTTNGPYPSHTDAFARFSNTGADFLPALADELFDANGNAHPNVVIGNPHKIYGPTTTDLFLQLRRQRIQRVVLMGQAANLCTEGHMRDLMENGFEVISVTDAIAGPQFGETLDPFGTGAPGEEVQIDGSISGFINAAFQADDLCTTQNVLDAINARFDTSNEEQNEWTRYRSGSHSCINHDNFQAYGYEDCRDEE